MVSAAFLLILALALNICCPASKPRFRIVMAGLSLLNLFSISFCADIDECAENTHNCSQVCEDATPGFKCSCRPGYRMDEDSICIGKLLFHRMA